MTKSLLELVRRCNELRLTVHAQRRLAKEPYVAALRSHFWEIENPGEPLPEQVQPMLLSDWNDLTTYEAADIERDDSGWCAQEKKDGVRALFHVTEQGVRVTGRTVSEVNYRLPEYQANLTHLSTGFDSLVGTIFDGELVCPVAEVDTGETMTGHPLQAAVAILATTPDKAKVIQDRYVCRLRFAAFDVIRLNGRDVTFCPLHERLGLLAEALSSATNPHIDPVNYHVEDKLFFHQLAIAEGKEGTVWKKLDQPYEAGQRVDHWIKRKRCLDVHAVVTGFKPGTAGKGNAELVGAVEFSTADDRGAMTPIAWVSNWSDEECRRMTKREGDAISLDPNYFGKKAILSGQDFAAKSGRIRHARLIRWAA